MADAAKPDTRFNLSRWAIEHPSVTRFLVAIVVIAGVLGLMSIGQKEDPDFTFRVMIVQVMWPGASLTDMQDQVVNKIERKLQETPHLDFVRSFTRAGSAIITVQIKGDTFGRDVTDAFYQVRKKVGDIASELPSGILWALLQRRVRRHLHHPPRDHRRRLFLPRAEVLRDRGARRALRVPGVEKVVILGDQPQKLYIDVSSKVLAERGISVLDIQNALVRPERRRLRPAASRRRPLRPRHRRRRHRPSRGPRRPPPQARRTGRPPRRHRDRHQRPRRPVHAASIRFDGKDAVEVGVVMAPGFNVTSRRQGRPQGT